MATDYYALMIIHTNLNLCHQYIVKSSWWMNTMYKRCLLEITAHYTFLQHCTWKGNTSQEGRNYNITSYMTWLLQILALVWYNFPYAKSLDSPCKMV